MSSGFRLFNHTSVYRGMVISDAYKKWLRRGDTVIDVGCGTGIITKILSDTLKIKIIGCDIKNYLVVDLPFIKIQGKKLPFLNQSIDVVLLNDVMHHLQKTKQEELLKDSLRISKKVLMFEAEPTLIGKICDVILNRMHYQSLDTPLTFRTIEDWEELFKKLSLRYKSVKLKKPFWYPFNHIAFQIWK